MLFFIFFLSLNTSFGQVKKKDQDVDIISHQVKLGETIRMLSKKYLVDPAEIYKLNKFAVNGISEGMVLQIPVPKKIAATIQEPVLVEKTEDVPKEESQKINEEVVTQEKQIISKPVVAKPIIKIEKAVTVINRDGKEINHTVEPKETLYSISKKYNISVDEIKLSNEKLLKNGLKIGQVIKIPSIRLLENNESSLGSDLTPSSSSSETNLNQNKNSETIIKHKVAPKETLFSLSKQYNVSVEEIKQQNEFLLQKGLQIGQVLTIKKSN